MFKKVLLFVLGLYSITSYSFAQNTNSTFTSFMQSNYGLSISKNFANVNKYCKTSPISKGLKISIQDCDKRIRNFIQESYDTIYNGNTNNLGAELSTVYITLNNALKNKELSNNYSVAGLSSDKQIEDQRNIINSIIKGNPSKIKMTIDQNIAIQIASLQVILNDYIINNNKSNASIVNNTQENNIKDCKNDYNCFIEQSKTCALSKLTKDTIIDMFGITTTTKSSYEIKGLKNNKCNFYLKTIEQKVLYSSGYVQMGLNNGLTMDEINEELEAANQQTKAVKGLDGTCNLTTTYLTQVLNEWKIGTFNTKQLTSKDCSGKLFPNNSMTMTFNL